MRTSSKTIAALAFAGLAAGGGAALTGTGLDNQAGASQFIGDTVSQSVTGSTLNGITYSFVADTGSTQVSSISLDLTAATGTHVTATATGGGAGVGTFTCTDIATNASSCTYSPAVSGSDGNPGYLGLTSLAVTVS